MNASQPIFTAHNHHSPSCGKPPAPAVGANLYRGYFENPYGEQWMFTFDRSAGEIEVRGGDLGWENAYTVISFEEFYGGAPEIAQDELRRIHGDWLIMGDEGTIVLGEAERAWVASCMLAVCEKWKAMRAASSAAVVAVFPVAKGGI